MNRSPSPPSDESAPDATLPDSFAPNLLAWFRDRRRDLPWRSREDPYAIWVSEIMLQQTQVSTVIPYYERFMERFPTLRDLAESSEEEALALWAGLGYYSRARNLRRGAQDVIERFNGQIPSTVEELLTIRGIGRYTAGAIASIAFNRDAPLLDGNVMRVLCRLFRLSGDPKRAPLNRRLWEIEERLIPEGEAREFNPAMMELGATICAPRSPKCGDCPVAAHCQAYRQGDAERYPENAPQSPPERVFMVCGVIVQDETERVLLVQPKAEGRWGGLWQFPNAPLGEGEDCAESLERLLQSMNLSAKPAGAVATIRHGITRFAITLRALEYRSEPDADPITPHPHRWATKDELRTLPLPSPHRKIALAWMRGAKEASQALRQLELNMEE